MTTEEKQLLLKDLCARLPYGVKINIRSDYTLTMEDMEFNAYHLTAVSYDFEYRRLRPYLRPMLSMTEEEKEEIRQQFCYEWEESVTELMYYSIEIGDADCLIDWFLEHHFDFRGLIPKGLALEAPEGMYKH